MNNLFRLLQLSDPALPIGGFSHSAGLETYVQHGIVKDKTSAKKFIEAQLSRNIFHTDAAFVSLAYDAASQNDLNELINLDEECTAVKLPKEMREASRKLGLRLLKIFSMANESEIMQAYKAAVKAGDALGNYSVAFGAIAASLNVDKEETLTGFFYNAAAGMVTNGVKLIPLGQIDGQEILFSLQQMIQELATKSLQPDRELIGLCCTGFDIRCMQHEELYSRLYMS